MYNQEYIKKAFKCVGLAPWDLKIYLNLLVKFIEVLSDVSLGIHQEMLLECAGLAQQDLYVYLSSIQWMLHHEYFRMSVDIWGYPQGDP